MKLIDKLIKLKRCPECGTKPKPYPIHDAPKARYYQCPNCYFIGPYSKSEQHARKAWNKRK